MNLKFDFTVWWVVVGCALLFLADALLLWKSQVYRDIYRRLYGEGWVTSQLLFRIVFLGFFCVVAWFGWVK